VELDPRLLHLAVRWVHVAAMAVALGGSILVLAVALRRAAGSAAVVLQVAATYEWAFWAAMGVLAMTGIGNLGAFGTALPAPASAWGGTFELKLVFVLTLVLVSVPRTLALLMLATTPAERGLRTMRRLYGGTSGAFALILALAVTLAHG
jgi:hypothetical protein